MVEYKIQDTRRWIRKQKQVQGRGRRYRGCRGTCVGVIGLLGQQVHGAEWILPILRTLRKVGVTGTCVGVTGRTCAGESRDKFHKCS